MSEKPSATSSYSRQLALSLSSRPVAGFTNFVEPEGGQVIRIIRDFLLAPDDMVLFISGDYASGKSHLLLAAAAEADEGSSFYLPLKELVSESPQILQALESKALICLDDIDSVAASEAWQIALFHLFNRCHQKRSKWLVAGAQTPLNLNIALADLRTRLGWGVTIRLPRLAEEKRLVVLDAQAKHFGLSLSNEVKHYIIRRAPRDLNSLTELLYQLEQASLQEKRPLSIPFVKAQLGW